MGFVLAASPFALSTLSRRRLGGRVGINVLNHMVLLYHCRQTKVEAYKRWKIVRRYWWFGDANRRITFHIPITDFITGLLSRRRWSTDWMAKSQQDTTACYAVLIVKHKTQRTQGFLSSLDYSNSHSRKPPNATITKIDSGRCRERKRLLVNGEYMCQWGVAAKLQAFKQFQPLGN
eukprot:scaffold431659_cov16-Prasinocladus_malaysianus.AAC.1